MAHNTTNPKNQPDFVPNPYNPDRARAMICDTPDEALAVMNGLRTIMGYDFESPDDANAIGWIAAKLMADMGKIYSQTEIARQCLITPETRQLRAELMEKAA